MAHSNAVLLALLVAMTFLLAAFIAAVIGANLDPTDSPAQPAPPGVGPAGALPVRQPAAAPTALRQSPRSPARTSPSEPGLRPWLVAAVFMVGLIIAAAGGWLFLSTGTGACTIQGAAICAQGYVLLTTTQLFGGAIALAGIALIFGAAFLALREQD
jgi:hypothetical protein